MTDTEGRKCVAIVVDSVAMTEERVREIVETVSDVALKAESEFDVPFNFSFPPSFISFL